MTVGVLIKKEMILRTRVTVEVYRVHKVYSDKHYLYITKSLPNKAVLLLTSNFYQETLYISVLIS